MLLPQLVEGLHTEEHTILARAYDTCRPLKLALVELQPGQEGPIRLPNAGRRAMDYLKLVIDGEAEFLSDVTTNHTNDPIAIYHGIWNDNGNNAGWWLPEYFKIDGVEVVLVTCPRCSFTFDIGLTFQWTGVEHPDIESCRCPCCYLQSGGPEGYTFDDFKTYEPVA